MINWTIHDNRKEVLDALDKQSEKALWAVGMQAERHAKEGCPVVTGRLRNSITFAVSKRQSGGSPPAKPDDWQAKERPGKGTVYIGTNVEYAPYVELGSGKRKARHFLKNAAQNYSDEYKAILSRYLKGDS